VKHGITLAAIVFVLALAAGCGTPTGPAGGSTPPATSPAGGRESRTATPQPTKPAQQPIAPTAAPTPVSGFLTLTWWTPEFISPKASPPAGPLLAKYLAEFEAAQEGKVRVNAVLKARYGKGGLLDYLRTAQPVAPGLLPDLIALDVSELEQAVGLGLLRPLDGLLDPALLADLYPFAHQSGQFGDQLLAVVYLADIEHVIYNRGRVPDPPGNWTGLLTGKIPYLFPAGSPQPLPSATTAEDIQHSFISQYLSAGASFDPKARHLTIQEQPLLRVLSFYVDARQAGLLPADIAEVTSLNDTWTAYVQGQVPVANVSARSYLAGRAGLKDTGFAPSPGWSSPVRPVGTGWVLAITAADPARQQIATALIAWLLTPERAGPFAQAAGWLPPSSKALNTWGSDPYFDFLDDQLAAAVSHPIGTDYGITAARLQRAVMAVLKGTAKPTEAVQAALGTSK
jgi:ABC-type glycerol-3-phosphate transport system substrate-binding protein